MITLKLTPAQAIELRDLLNSMNIEPVPPSARLIEIFDQPVEHPLWPLLKQLRNLIALQPAAIVHCAICGEPVERSKRGGKPKLYCSAACKQKAVRQKALERKKAIWLKRK